MCPDREHHLAPSVRPKITATKVATAGTIAEPEGADQSGDHDRVDELAAFTLEPDRDLRIATRTELDADRAMVRRGDWRGDRQKRRQSHASEARSEPKASE